MAEVDLVIRGGTVADGTGGPLREADIAVHRGRIAAIGQVAQSGTEEIDAKGLLVTPGFIDVHTHYDGQLTWSERLLPSSNHGVTTVVTGNCGVGFAPCRIEDRDNLIRLMEGVEDIPEIVMAEGLPWDWNSFPDFLDAVERRPHDIDFAVLLPHSPLRVFVMGERAVDLEPATENDRAKMRELAREAMLAGAVGFSTSRNIFHRTSTGSMIPSISAEEQELGEIAQGLADVGRGVLQGIFGSGQPDVSGYEIFHRIARHSGRPVSYTLLQNAGQEQVWRDVVAMIERDRAEGLDVMAQVFNRPLGVILGLEASFNPFSGHPYYIEALAHLPRAERVREMRKAEVRRRLLQPLSVDVHPLAGLFRYFGGMFPMGECPVYEPYPAASCAAMASEKGISPEELVYDLLLERDGRAMLYVAASNYGTGSLEPTLELLRRDDTVLALGDGGAHYGMICDGSYPTTMLAHWVRDRDRGERIELSDAVRMLTDAPARLHRFHDRGRIAPGLKADLNIIDMDRLQMFSPAAVYDLPAGGRRLDQRVEGYVATFVSGVAIQREGQDTGARPGRLVRDAGI